MSTCLADVDVHVLAGGLGTRLRPVLEAVPKLLAPIGERPFLSYLLEWLRTFGARRVSLGLGYKAEAITSWLASADIGDMTVATIVEPCPLGTAGAIRLARPQLTTDPVMVVNGDSFVR